MARISVDGALRSTLLVVALYATGCPLRCVAQFGPLSIPSQAPQARSQEELDAYLLLVTGINGPELIRNVDSFAAHFPESELLGLAYQYQMHAYQRLDDFNGTLSAGRKALAATPDNLDTLLTLAPAMMNHVPQGPSRSQFLVEAEGYARRALEGLQKVKPPHSLPLESWERQKRSMQCQAHESLGVIAIDRGQKEEAIREFQTVLQLAGTPDGSQYFRLGLALESAGRVSEAAANFHRAIDLGPSTVERLASRELEKLSKSDP